jgi:hypothetical protein
MSTMNDPGPALGPNAIELLIRIQSHIDAAHALMDEFRVRFGEGWTQPTRLVPVILKDPGRGMRARVNAVEGEVPGE